MNYRFMRLMVFFDLPMLTDANRKEYARFHKFLLKNGFIMMQKSVYTKLAVNNVASALLRQKVRENLPAEGLIELLEVTENQFAKIEYLSGSSRQQTLNDTERLVEI